MKTFVQSLVCLLTLASGSLHAFEDDGCCWWNNTYVGFDGGFSTGLSKAKNSFSVGATIDGGNGLATNAMILPGWHVGAKIGYAGCSWWRTELAYTFFQSRYNWETVFGVALDPVVPFATTDVFEAQLNVHTLLFNTYVHLDRICCPSGECWCISPYITGGIGVSWNDLHDIREFSSQAFPSPPFFTASIADHTRANFAGRFGFGLLTRLGCHWRLDTSLNATYIGTVRSGTSGEFSEESGRTPVDFSVSPYTFKNNWLGSFSVGLQYVF